MRPAWVFLSVIVGSASCKPRDAAAVPSEAKTNHPAVLTSSEALVVNFPLLPLVEKSLWRQLLDAEARAASSRSLMRVEAVKEVDRLTEKLRKRHPFKADGDRLELGGVVYDKVKKCFSLTARVHYPDVGDDRHPGELELLLCSESGRMHETLLVCQARPLHLELLLHLAGHANGERFQIEILANSGERIPVNSLLKPKNDGAEVPTIRWEFSGSEFKDLYAPDLTGDFAVFWHAHDSVLRVDHDEIASGTLKLEAVHHSALPQGAQVTVLISPVE